MKRIRLTVWAAATVAALGQGCANEPAPMLESRLGDSVRTSQAQQTIDLDASSNADPVTGIDGTSAKISVDRYYRSFEAPPPTFTIINVGGSTAR